MMVKNLFLMALFMWQHVNAQPIHSDPLPDCNQIQRVGTSHPNGDSTLYWVNGIGVNDNQCEGVSIQVSGIMRDGDFAYAIVDLDQFIYLTPEEVEFSIDLTNVFQSLPLSENVTVTNLHGNGTAVAEMVLIKTSNPASSSEKPSQGFISDEIWIVKIKWFGSFITMVTEDVFVFQENETIYFNYLWDDSDMSAPVALISLGGNKISVSPYTDPGISVVNSSDGGNPFEAKTLSLGLINSSAILLDGDRIDFDLNLIDPSSPGM